MTAEWNYEQLLEAFDDELGVLEDVIDAARATIADATAKMDAVSRAREPVADLVRLYSGGQLTIPPAPIPTRQPAKPAKATSPRPRGGTAAQGRENRKRILEYIVAAEGTVTSRELQEALGLTQTNVDKHLKLLVREGLIAGEAIPGRGVTRHYRPQRGRTDSPGTSAAAEPPTSPPTSPSDEKPPARPATATDAPTDGLAPHGPTLADGQLASTEAREARDGQTSLARIRIGTHEDSRRAPLLSKLARKDGDGTTPQSGPPIVARTDDELHQRPDHRQIAPEPNAADAKRRAEEAAAWDAETGTNGDTAGSDSSTSDEVAEPEAQLPEDLADLVDEDDEEGDEAMPAYDNLDDDDPGSVDFDDTAERTPDGHVISSRVRKLLDSEPARDRHHDDTELSAPEWKLLRWLATHEYSNAREAANALVRNVHEVGVDLRRLIGMTLVARTEAGTFHLTDHGKELADERSTATAGS